MDLPVVRKVQAIERLCVLYENPKATKAGLKTLREACKVLGLTDEETQEVVVLMEYNYVEES